MRANLKPGDRVRLKDTVSFGTVVEVVDETALGVTSEARVEWDGHEGEARAVRVNDLDYVRPPPRTWSSCAGPLSCYDR